MEFQNTVNTRQSVRDFSEKTIPQETLESIVQIAGKSPSWVNTQPWKVYIATGDTLAKIKQEHLELTEKESTEPTDVAPLHRDSVNTKAQNNMAQFFDAAGKLPGNDFAESQGKLYNAPALVYLTLKKGASAYSLYDLGAFGQTLMLAATDQGIDSIPAYEIVKFPQSIHNLMEIPNNEEIVIGIALGYRSDNKLNNFRTKRNSIDTILKIKD